MRNQIVNIIYAVIDSENELREEPIDRSKGEDTPLYGPAGHLDSMGLVSLVVGVEQAMEDQLNIQLTLVSDSAMSSRRSPFATVGSFANYVASMVEEVARV